MGSGERQTALPAHWKPRRWTRFSVSGEAREMNRRVNVIGVALPPFFLPAAPYAGASLASEAIRLALADAAIDYTRVEAVYSGAAGAIPGAGQAACRALGLTGVPVFNLDNGGASGSSALYLARQAIEFGAAECVLAIGFEANDARSAQLEIARSNALFAQASGAYLARYGARQESLAMVAVKAREHAARNPGALFREILSLEQIMAEEPRFESLSVSQCCQPVAGAAAVVLCSDAFARKHGLARSVQILAQTQCSDLPGGEEGGVIKAAGYDLAVLAARQVYEQASVGPGEVEVCELHDATSIGEVLLYEALGFCREGDAEKLIEDGDNTYGGNRVINPSGGLLSRGHPLGATGLAQCAELVWQLRGAAGARQVPGVRHALQHNQGLDGAAVVTLYRRD